MSDQQAPPQNGDTPAVAGPHEAPGTAPDQPQVPEGDLTYEQRYKDVQAEYTRSQQENAELKQYREWAQVALTSQDPDIQRQAYEVLGIEVGDESEEDYSDVEEFTDDEPFVSRTEWEQFQAQQRQEQQQAQTAMENEYIADNARAQLEQMGLEEMDDNARLFILNQALSLPRLPLAPGHPPSGLLDMKSAYEQFQALMDNQMKSWAKTKRAPYVSPGGLPANEVPDPGHGQQARMNRAMLSLRNNIGDE